jgi:peptidoglycan/xylan/chitin deacetylase (PgdA/CDA1 family)
MIVVVIRPWQARLIMALAFAVFLAGAYHLADQTSITSVLGPPPLSEPLFAIPGAEAMVGLAVNVDWGGDQIPTMLALFREARAHVTFFLTGRWAQENKELARLIAEEGHEIGNHGFTHTHPKQLTNQQLADHITKNQKHAGGNRREGGQALRPSVWGVGPAHCTRSRFVRISHRAVDR